MTPDLKYLRNLLKKIAELNTTGSQELPSRFEWKAWDPSLVPGAILIGGDHYEQHTQHRNRDFHLKYALDKGYVTYKYKIINGEKEFVGGRITVTSAGHDFILQGNVWLKISFAFEYLFSNIWAPIIVAVAAATILIYLGIKS